MTYRTQSGNLTQVLNYSDLESMDSILGTIPGLALAATRLDPSQYLDADTLASSLETVHKLLFTFAMHNFFTFENVSPEDRIGIIKGTFNAVVVVRTVALIVECSLGVVVFLCLALSYPEGKRTSQLTNDPASLRDIVLMMGTEMPVDSIVDKSEAGECRASLSHGRMRIQTSRKKLGNEKSIKGRRKEDWRFFDTHEQNEKTLVRPTELKMWVAVVSVLVLALAMIVLTYTRTMAKENNGLSPLYGNTVLAQMMINYLPVLFATFLEPFWTLLNRVL